MAQRPMPDITINSTFADWRSIINSWSSRLNDIEILEEDQNIVNSNPNAIARVSNVWEATFIMNMLLEDVI